MKLGTIEELRNRGVISLIECNEEEKHSNKNVVKNSKNGKWYKIDESNEEIIIELLSRSFQCISIIKSIMVGFATVFVLYILFIILAII